jgi:hypothetical protein
MDTDSGIDWITLDLGTACASHWASTIGLGVYSRPVLANHKVSDCMIGRIVFGHIRFGILMKYK